MKKSIAALGLLSLAACANPYVGTPYTAPAVPVTSVAIVDDTLGDDAVAYEAASTMGNFGLLGALIDAGVQGSRKSRVNEALESVNHTPEANFESYLIAALAEADIEAAMLDGPDRDKREFLEDYPTAPEGVQALIDFNVTAYGYVNSGNQLWRPTVAADVRMIDAGTGATLMENRIIYNPVDAQAGIVTIAPSPDYAFQNREDMISQPERLAEGIDVALKEVAETAVRLMR
ncbi:hypothetical protein GRI34_02500 [Erythrobacter aquimaris]|uniref:Curli production assembly/transport component CsgG n=1 Tax=Qipengyuania aquimaris TaxID=255984 RepID=A0A6I4TJ76_9SPHN|nr:hypothetical protein [Qipengyuania aquimaris]MXO95289.1 hypothetical protein [Qipengyuania aquimaris]